MRQEYSRTTLQTTLDQYPNLGTIGKTKLFLEGFENSNIYTETDKGKYVVKVFEGKEMSEESIFFEIKVMNHAYQSEVKTPRVLSTKNGFFHTKLDHKIVIVMDYIKGANMDKKAISDAVAYELGQQTGKMDKALKIFKEDKTRQNYEFDLKNLLILEKYIQKLSSNYNKEIISKVLDDFKKIKSQFDDMPKGIIHNDIVLHNILVDENELMGILDFSDMAMSPYIQNVATTFNQTFFTYNWKPHQGKLFIEGYKEYNELNQDELRILYDLVAARYALIILAFTMWNINSGEDKQRVDFMWDNYKFLKKFIKLGKEKFNKLIF